MRELDIDTLVPHRRPLRLIDEILTVDGHCATTAAVVTPDWPSFSAGTVSALLMIELVAQTAAVVGGYKALTAPSPTKVRMGMLVAIKQAHFEVDTLPVGARLVTRATTHALLENFKEIKGSVTIDDQIVCEMTLQGVQSA
jgi:predicted hotdog family 3-hydroxylacyl-ACP dehydratase